MDFEQDIEARVQAAVAIREAGEDAFSTEKALQVGRMWRLLVDSGLDCESSRLHGEGYFALCPNASVVVSPDGTFCRREHPWRATPAGEMLPELRDGSSTALKCASVVVSPDGTFCRREHRLRATSASEMLQELRDGSSTALKCGGVLGGLFAIGLPTTLPTIGSLPLLAGTVLGGMLGIGLFLALLYAVSRKTSDWNYPPIEPGPDLREAVELAYDDIQRMLAAVEQNRARVREINSFAETSVIERLAAANRKALARPRGGSSRI